MMPRTIDEIDEIVEWEVEEVEEEMPVSYTGLTYYDETVECYLKSVALIPLLTLEEEKALTRKIWELQERIAQLEEQIKTEANPIALQEELKTAIGDYHTLCDKMWKSNLRLVIKIARKYWPKVASKIDFSDLVEEGNLGIRQAIEKFDPRRGYKFSTYACHWIRQAITRAMNNKVGIIRLPVHVDSQGAKIDSARKRLRQGGREVTIESLARETNLPLQTVERAVKARPLRNLLSWDFPSPKDDDGTKTFGDSIASNRPSPEEEALNNIALQEIKAVLEGLSEREKAVINLRFGLADGIERTLEEVGNVFDVTRERIRQIEEGALMKLRHPKRARKLRGFLEEK